MKKVLKANRLSFSGFSVVSISRPPRVGLGRPEVPEQQLHDPVGLPRPTIPDHQKVAPPRTPVARQVVLEVEVVLVAQPHLGPERPLVHLLELPVLGPEAVADIGLLVGVDHDADPLEVGVAELVDLLEGILVQREDPGAGRDVALGGRIVVEVYLAGRLLRASALLVYLDALGITGTLL